MQTLVAFFIYTSIIKVIPNFPQHNKSHEAELVRMKRMIATHGAACGDIRHIGGVMRGEVTERGFWDVCFDPEIGLHPLSCLVYSFGYVFLYQARLQIINMKPATSLLHRQL